MSLAKNLHKLHFISSLVLLMFLSASMGYYYISSEFGQFNKLILELEDRYIQEQKEDHLKNDVDSVISLIETENTNLNITAKNLLQNRANQLTKITNKVYDTLLINKNYSKEQIKQHLLDIANTFDWKYNQSTIEVLDNTISQQYAIEMINDKEFATIIIPFEKLNLSFKLVMDLKDFSENFQLDCIKKIKTLNQINSQNLFMFDSKLNILYDKNFDKVNYMDLKDAKYIELINKLKDISKNGEFVEYIKSSGEKQYFYARYYQHKDWIIGSYVNFSDIQKILNTRNDELKIAVLENIKKTILYFIIFAFIALFISFALGKKLSMMFKEYQDKLDKHNQDVVNANELLNTIIDSTEDLISYKDKNLKYVLCNKAFCSFVGKSKDDIIGKDDFEVFDTELANIFREEDSYVLNNDESIYVENILEDTKGLSIYFYTHKSVAKDNQNNVLGLVSFARNFTQTQNLINQLSSTNEALEEKVKSRTSELEELNKSLEEKVHAEVEKNRQKDKIVQNSIKQAQMGEMLSMIAHQWRQPLSTISTIGANMQVEVSLGIHTKDTIIDELKQIEAHTQFLSRTINDFRNFFNPNKLKEDVLLTDIIDKSVNIFAKNIENNKISLVKNYQFQENISIYSNEVMQVILNLIKNAIDVFNEREITKPTITINGYENETIQTIEVIDNGGGIDTKVIDKIFDPYFSTKDEKNGTGLGLYMSKTIIEEHCDGKIYVENYQDGCKFVIEFLKKAKEGI